MCTTVIQHYEVFEGNLQGAKFHLLTRVEKVILLASCNRIIVLLPLLMVLYPLKFTTG